MLNRNFNDFKFQHKKNKNQILYTSRKTQDDREVLNLIDNFLNEKNSFIFESVEKGKIKGRYTIFGKNPDKIWEFNNKNSYLITNKAKKKIKDTEISTESNIFNAISNEASAENRIGILKSYDYLLNSKYKVTVNEKTLDRVKNYFR